MKKRASRTKNAIQRERARSELLGDAVTDSEQGKAMKRMYADCIVVTIVCLFAWQAAGAEWRVGTNRSTTISPPQRILLFSSEGFMTIQTDQARPYLSS